MGDYVPGIGAPWRYLAEPNRYRASLCLTSRSDPNGPAGAPPWQSLRSANRELLETLYYAFTEFKNKGDGGREGVRLACQAAARFIGVRHENPELAVPFLAILSSAG